MAARSLALLVPFALTSASGALADPWDIVTRILQVFPLSNLAFSAGDATGRKFMFEKGNTTMASPLPMASASKFPASLAIVGAVAARHLSFETYAHEVFRWWTSDAADPRSRVTLRHLLTFTSGFYSPNGGGDLPCLVTIGTSNYTAEECAKQIYEQAPFEFEPGSTWCYNSFHLQVAGAMASKAAGLSVQELLHRNLIGRLKLTGTQWTGGENPQLAGNMVTTGDDYDKILRAFLSFELVPKALADEMERDYLDPHVKIANSSATLTKLLGHYSMCTYFECLPPKVQEFTEGCRRENIHVDAGLFGYYPLVDRSRGTYMQVVMMKMVHGQEDFFLPTMSSMVLRRIVKGYADRAILNASSPAPHDQPDLSEEGLWREFQAVLHGADLPGRHRSRAKVWAALTDTACATPPGEAVDATVIV